MRAFAVRPGPSEERSDAGAVMGPLGITHRRVRHLVDGYGLAPTVQRGSTRAHSTTRGLRREA